MASRNEPINDWQRYEETIEHIKLARSRFASSGNLTEREAMLHKLIGWCEIEIRKLQQGEESGR